MAVKQVPIKLLKKPNICMQPDAKSHSSVELLYVQTTTISQPRDTVYTLYAASVAINTTLIQ